MNNRRLLLRTAVLAGLVMPASPAIAKGKPGTPGAATAAIPITSSGPLTNIELSTTLACQVSYAGYGTGQFYPGVSGAPADRGTFLATGGTLYAPDFAAHANGTASGMIGASTPFTPVSQTSHTGAGTQANPYIVTNNATSSRGGLLYHAFDCYLRGSDGGTGFAVTNPSAQTTRVGCASGKYLEQLTSLTAENRYYEDSYFDVWSRIANKLTLPNTTRPEFHDNAAAIQWEFSVPPNGSLIRSFLTEFVLPPVRIDIRKDRVDVGVHGSVGENPFDFEFSVPRPI